MGEEASNEREAGESGYHCAGGTSAVPLTEIGVKLYKENRAFVFLCWLCWTQTDGCKWGKSQT